MTPCDSMPEASPERILPLVQHRLTEQKLRLFACACCRRVWRLLAQENRRIVEAAEQHARGRLTKGELIAIAQTVSGADEAAELRAIEDHRASARYEAATAAWQCATLPAADAAWFASRCAAAAVADDADPDPASDSWRTAERAERAAQANLLRDLLELPGLAQVARTAPRHSLDSKLKSPADSET